MIWLAMNLLPKRKSHFDCNVLNHKAAFRPQIVAAASRRRNGDRRSPPDCGETPQLPMISARRGEVIVQTLERYT